MDKQLQCTPVLWRLSLNMLVAAMALFGPGPAAAYEWLPEFQSLTESEEERIEGPERLNPEYQSDHLTYTRDLAWEYVWLSREHALDFSTGSLSARHFLLGERLKIHEKLSEQVEARFTHFREGDLERNDSHNILELVLWPWRFLGVSLYGEPSLYKREDDTGLALLLKPHDRHEIRLFNTFVDVTRIRRNDRTDTYIEPDVPHSRGIVGRLWADPEGPHGGPWSGNFVEYAARLETRTKWRFPDLKYDYEYWKLFTSFLFSRSLTPVMRLEGRAQWDRKFESRLPLAAESAFPREVVRRDRLFLLARGIFSELGPWRNWELTAGFQWAARTWVTDLGTARYRDVVPHFWLSLPALGKGIHEDRFRVGVDLLRHGVSGPEALFNPDEDEVNGQLHARLNLGYDFHFGDKAIIRLVASGDLDQFGTRKSWEGGNGQFILKF